MEREQEEKMNRELEEKALAEIMAQHGGAEVPPVAETPKPAQEVVVPAVEEEIPYSESDATEPEPAPEAKVDTEAELAELKKFLDVAYQDIIEPLFNQAKQAIEQEDFEGCQNILDQVEAKWTEYQNDIDGLPKNEASRLFQNYYDVGTKIVKDTITEIKKSSKEKKQLIVPKPPLPENPNPVPIPEPPKPEVVRDIAKEVAEMKGKIYKVYDQANLDLDNAEQAIIGNNEAAFKRLIEDAKKKVVDFNANEINSKPVDEVIKEGRAYYYAQLAGFKDRMQDLINQWDNHIKQQKVANLEASRVAYIASKQKLDNVSGIKRLLHLGTSKADVEIELQVSRAVYEKARAEYVGYSVDNFLEEKTKLLESQMDMYSKSRMTKFMDWYKKQSDHNVLNWYENKYNKKVENRGARFGLRMLNRRTLMSGVLGGVSIVSGGGLVALGAWASGRLISTVGTGGVSYDLLSMARNGVNRSNIEKQVKAPILNIEKIEQYMAELESRALLNGKSVADLEKDELYIQVKERYNKETQEALAVEADLAGYLERQGAKADANLVDALKSEKTNRVGLAFTSAVIGAGVGLGTGYLTQRLLGKVIGHNGGGNSGIPKAGAQGPTLEDLKNLPENHFKVPLGGKVPPVSGENAPTLEDLKNLPVDRHVLPFGKNIGSIPPIENAPVPTGGAVGEISITSRGVEGTLLDQLKDNNHPNTLKWLQDHYTSTKGDNSPGALVHRFVLDHKLEGKPGQDWQNILKGTLQIKPDGEIVLSEDHVKFFTPHESAAAGDTSLAPKEPGLDSAPELNNGRLGHPVAESVPNKDQTPSSEAIPQNNVEKAQAAIQKLDKISDEYIAQHGQEAYMQELQKEYVQKYGQAAYNELVSNGHSSAAIGTTQHNFDNIINKARIKGNIAKAYLEEKANGSVHNPETAQELAQTIKNDPDVIDFKKQGQDYIAKYGQHAYDLVIKNGRSGSAFDSQQALEDSRLFLASVKADAAREHIRSDQFHRQSEALIKRMADERQSLKDMVPKPAATPEAHNLTPQEIAAEQIGADVSVSKAFEKIWGHEFYQNFMKKYELSPRILNGEASKMTIHDFVSKIDGDIKFRKKFFGIGKLLAESTEGHDDKFTDQFFQKVTIREFVIKWLPKIWEK